MCLLERPPGPPLAAAFSIADPVLGFVRVGFFEDRAAARTPAQAIRRYRRAAAAQDP